MDNLYYLIKLHSFDDLHRLLKDTKGFPEYRSASIVHLDFNLFGIDNQGMKILDQLDIRFDVIDPNVPRINLLDFYDYENRKFKPHHVFDFSPDYDELNPFLYEIIPDIIKIIKK